MHLQPAPIVPHDQQRIRKVCKHKAGHYIMAKAIRFETDGIVATVQPLKGQ